MLDEEAQALAAVEQRQASTGACVPSPSQAEGDRATVEESLCEHNKAISEV